MFLPYHGFSSALITRCKEDERFSIQHPLGMQRRDFAAKDGIGSLGPNPVRRPLSVSRADKRPRKEKNREIRLENAAFCENPQAGF
jgi:hypothetical protein